jgi:hypothetical protein
VKRSASLLVPLLIFSLVLPAFSISLVSAAEDSPELWSKTYGGDGKDASTSLVEASDGGYTLVGYTMSFGAGSWDVWLVKTDMYGNMEWNQTYGGKGHEEAYSLVVTSDGGYVLAGYTESFGAGGTDFWLIKIDAYGNVEWNQTYGGAQYEYARSLVETSDGGYAIAGFKGSQTIDFQAGDFWLVKTDSYGNIMWNHTYGRATRDFAYSLIETSDEGYALAGNSGAPYTAYGSADVWLVKTDAYGNIEWNQTYGKGTAYSLVETSDGGYALAGFSDSFEGPRNVLLLKTDANGNMVWNHTYGGENNDEVNSLVETSDGGYAIAGATNSFGAGGTDFWLIKIDAYGNVEWNQTYGGAEFERSYSLVETSDRGYALVGTTNSFGAGKHDYWLVKTDEYGVIPEFPSLAPLITLVAVVAITFVYRNKLKKQRRRRFDVI